MLKQSFDEHIKPMIEEKIVQMTTNLRICLAIAEGKSIDQINQFQSNVENIKDFLRDSKPISQLVDDMNSQICKAKEINSKSKEMKQEMRNELDTITGQINEYIDLIGSNFVIETLTSKQSAEITNLELQIQQAKKER